MRRRHADPEFTYQPPELTRKDGLRVARGPDQQWVSGSATPLLTASPPDSRAGPPRVHDQSPVADR